MLSFSWLSVWQNEDFKDDEQQKRQVKLFKGIMDGTGNELRRTIDASIHVDTRCAFPGLLSTLPLSCSARAGSLRAHGARMSDL